MPRRHLRRAVNPIEIADRVAGIPCLVHVTEFIEEPQTRWEPGYYEVDFYIADSKGRKAPWLERKLTREERQALEARVTRYLLNTYTL